jgi:hypothetical protein
MESNMPQYDRSKMQHKKDILRFEWGDFPAIGIKHFEERRDERTKPEGTDIFDESGLSDEIVLLRCFDFLKKKKYQDILDTIELNKPKHTEFIAAFETDEYADNGQFNFIFLVFSISVKETAMNGIEQGKNFLSCITIVKDTYKKKRRLNSNTVEETLCCYRGEFGGDEYFWKKTIPR